MRQGSRGNRRFREACVFQQESAPNSLGITYERQYVSIVANSGDGGDVFRRVTGTISCCRYGRNLADYFQPWGQYDVSVSGRIETKARIVTLVFEEGFTILSYDGANALTTFTATEVCRDQRKLSPKRYPMRLRTTETVVR